MNINLRGGQVQTQAKIEKLMNKINRTDTVNPNFTVWHTIHIVVKTIVDDVIGNNAVDGRTEDPAGEHQVGEMLALQDTKTYQFGRKTLRE